MGKLGLALLALMVCGYAPASSNKIADLKRDPRTNPPGKFLAPGYFVPAAFNAEVATIQCSDGYRMVGDIIRRKRPPPRLMPGIIFIHEPGRNRNSWYPLTVQMAGRGYVSLAIDLRGCGENPKLNGDARQTFEKLSRTSSGILVEDIRNAVSYLAMSPGIDPDNIAVIGSGLGANLALVAASQPWAGKIKVVVAVSPEPENRGLGTIEAAGKLGDKLTCLAASRGDSTSYQEAAEIFSAIRGPKEFFEGEGNASGVMMFGTRAVSTGKEVETPGVLFSYFPAWLYQGLFKDSLALPSGKKRLKR